MPPVVSLVTSHAGKEAVGLGVSEKHGHIDVNMVKKGGILYIEVHIEVDGHRVCQPLTPPPFMFRVLPPLFVSGGHSVGVAQSGRECRCVSFVFLSFCFLACDPILLFYVKYTPTN